MFMVKPNVAQQKKLQKIYKSVSVVYGEVPLQMAFLGNIDAGYLEDFLKGVLRIAKHPHIDPDLFSFLRLHVAFHEAYAYCKAFNTALLQKRGYAQEVLDRVIEDIGAVPLDESHRQLARFALKAIYESRTCTQADFDALYALGWSQKDVFDAIEHAGSIFRNGRILTAYTAKA
jgi:alkylhydroperoxidase/carboxymuconolactone decarboxylase family protein YurZ